MLNHLTQYILAHTHTQEQQRMHCLGKLSKKQAKRLKSLERRPEVDRLDGQLARWSIGPMVNRLDGQ